MGFKDIDVASPASGDLVSAGDDQIRALKADILAGMGQEHQVTGTSGQDGVHKFPLASSPSVQNVDGRIVFLDDGSADNPILNVEKSGAFRRVGLHRLLVASGSVTVNDNTGSEVNLATYSDAHALYIPSIHIDQNVDLNYGVGIASTSPAGLYAWIRRTRTGSATGNDKLALRNENTGVNIAVTYAVYKILL